MHSPASASVFVADFDFYLRVTGRIVTFDVVGLRRDQPVTINPVIGEVIDKYDCHAYPVDSTYHNG